jgi:hypothetical protein
VRAAGGQGRISFPRGRPCLCQQALEAPGVDRIVVHLERVAGASRHDARARGELSPQLRHVHLQHLHGRGGRRGPPQRVDEAVGRASHSALDEKRSKQPPLLGRRDPHSARRPGDLERAKDAKLARSTRPHALIVTPAEASVKGALYQASTGLLDARPDGRERGPTEGAAMAYAYVHDVAASWAQYERVAASLIDPAPAGLILHVAGTY